MKTIIVGWLYIIVSAVLIFSGLLSFLTIGGSFSNPAASIITALFSLGLGIFSFFMGSGIKGHKAWSWKAGVIFISLAMLGNLFTIVRGNFSMILGILLNAFCLYALFDEKELFFSTQATFDSKDKEEEEEKTTLDS